MLVRNLCGTAVRVVHLRMLLVELNSSFTAFSQIFKSFVWKVVSSYQQTAFWTFPDMSVVESSVSSFGGWESKCPGSETREKGKHLCFWLWVRSELCLVPFLSTLSFLLLNLPSHIWVVSAGDSMTAMDRTSGFCGLQRLPFWGGKGRWWGADLGYYVVGQRQSAKHPPCLHDSRGTFHSQLQESQDFHFKPANEALKCCVVSQHLTLWPLDDLKLLMGGQCAENHACCGCALSCQCPWELLQSVFSDAETQRRGGSGITPKIFLCLHGFQGLFLAFFSPITLPHVGGSLSL